MSEIVNSPQPEPSSIKRGPTSPERGQYPKGSEPKHGQSVAPGPSGDSQDG